jgi:hypothetical protein
MTPRITVIRKPAGRVVVRGANVGIPGLPGAKGDTGDQGSPGLAGAYFFDWDQGVAAAEWDVTYPPMGNGIKPMVRIVDSGGNEVEVEIQYVYDGFLRVISTSPFGGHAYLR